MQDARIRPSKISNVRNFPRALPFKPSYPARQNTLTMTCARAPANSLVRAPPVRLIHSGSTLWCLRRMLPGCSSSTPRLLAVLAAADRGGSGVKVFRLGVCNRHDSNTPPRLGNSFRIVQTNHANTKPFLPLQLSRQHPSTSCH